MSQDPTITKADKKKKNKSTKGGSSLATPPGRSRATTRATRGSSPGGEMPPAWVRERRSTVMASIKGNKRQISRMTEEAIQARNARLENAVTQRLTGSHMELFEKIDSALLRCLHENVSNLLQVLKDRMPNSMRGAPDDRIQEYMPTAEMWHEEVGTQRPINNFGASEWWVIRFPELTSTGKPVKGRYREAVAGDTSTSGYHIFKEWATHDVAMDSLEYHNQCLEMREAYINGIAKIAKKKSVNPRDKQNKADALFEKYLQTFMEMYEELILERGYRGINVGGQARGECEDLVNFDVNGQERPFRNTKIDRYISTTTTLWRDCPSQPGFKSSLFKSSR